MVQFEETNNLILNWIEKGVRYKILISNNILEETILSNVNEVTNNEFG